MRVESIGTNNQSQQIRAGFHKSSLEGDSWGPGQTRGAGLLSGGPKRARYQNSRVRELSSPLSCLHPEISHRGQYQLEDGRGKTQN